LSAGRYARTCWGDYSAPQTPIAGFKRPTSKEWSGGKGREGERKGRVGVREGRGGD